MENRPPLSAQPPNQASTAHFPATLLLRKSEDLIGEVTEVRQRHKALEEEIEELSILLDMAKTEGEDAFLKIKVRLLVKLEEAVQLRNTMVRQMLQLEELASVAKTQRSEIRQTMDALQKEINHAKMRTDLVIILVAILIPLSLIYIMRF
ncbi:hypothetical protein AOQ84DRAFT_361046 [Glonium stellatum]|uniref:Uncharacterized protein n=1 Tax=Glonium stellatum TaxID=574774 RepID=A0A8E2F7Z9_9PEZI|nr:hypothetical protein AOQ84DRAFT_361046 [Glonium stellatum]